MPTYFQRRANKANFFATETTNQTDGDTVSSELSVDSPDEKQVRGI